MDLPFYSQCLWFYFTHEPLFIFCGRVPLVDERLVLLLYCAFSGVVTFTLFKKKMHLVNCRKLLIFSHFTNSYIQLFA